MILKGKVTFKKELSMLEIFDSLEIMLTEKKEDVWVFRKDSY